MLSEIGADSYYCQYTPVTVGVILTGATSWTVHPMKEKKKLLAMENRCYNKIKT